MTVSTALALVAIGLLIGTLSGMVGIGGGILVIPVLMLFFNFPQARANGTSLAMLLPPIGIFAVLAYWRAGNVDWRYAGLLALGFAAGAYVGARLVNGGWINPVALRVTFALLLAYCAGRVLFRSGGRAGAALETSLLVVGFGLSYLLMRLLGRRWRQAPQWGAIYRRKQTLPLEYDYEI
jgi:uncharacterized membrane protein YfcA